MDDRKAPPPVQPTPVRWLAPLRAFMAGAVAALLLAVAMQGYLVVADGNVHEVLPGRVYRCRQPSPQQLQDLVKKYGIRTVVNMRGQEDSPWYLDESRATAQLDLSQEDLPFTAGRLPSVPVIRHLVQVLDQSEQPLLIHCRQGIDRTGLASVMVLLLYTDTPLDRALHPLSLRFGHLPLGRTGNLDRFFALYREWLADKGWTHSPATFRYWVEQEYCPGECLASFTLIEPCDEPLVMRRGEPLAVRIRCTNQSVKPWRFRPGTNAGIHVLWELRDANDQNYSAGRSGLFHAEVPPQGSIEITLAISPRYAPGRYSLRIDMVDEQHARFHELGADPLTVAVEVR